MEVKFYRSILTGMVDYKTRMYCYAMLGMLSIQEYQERINRP
jgi:hypothetical protein